MIKKIVRYGNSNALVLDKATLELLNIAEGSLVKIKTDGTSLIITPHEPQDIESETLTSEDATMLATLKSGVKGLLPEQEKELFGLIKKRSGLHKKAFSNVDFQKELVTVKKEYNPDTLEYFEQYELLLEKYAPGLQDISGQIDSFYEKPKDVESKKKSALSMFTDFFGKNQSKLQKSALKYQEVLNSEEYQHRAQLLADKYADNKNSKEYLEAQKELLREFCPEMVEIQDGVADITKKLNS